MFRAVVLFCAVLALTKEQTTNVNTCLLSSSGPLPINTHIVGCVSQPCGLPQGQNALVQVIFRAPYAIQRMRTSATGFLGIFPIPYDLGERSETCNTTKCPVEEGEVIRYTLSLPVEEYMPVGPQMAVEIRIHDDNHNPIVCFRFTFVVLPPTGAKN